MISLKRGDIVIADFGPRYVRSSVQAGLRPAIVLQNDNQNSASPTTIIAPLTTVLKKQALSSHVVIGKRFGLRERSMVLLEQIRTVNQTSVIKVVGHIDDDSVIDCLNQALLKTLGIHEDCTSSEEVLL